MVEQSQKQKYLIDVQEEQKLIQLGKDQARPLSEYDSLIFRGKLIYPLNEWEFTTPAEEQIDRYFGKHIFGIEELILAINETNGRPVNWVDMGSGRAIFMREQALSKKTQGKVKMWAIDIEDYDLKGLSQADLSFLENRTPGITDPETKPKVIIDNVEDVVLPEQADIITSVESIQYLNDPIKAICNWYNQLADGGFLIIARESPWSGKIVASSNFKKSLMEVFVEQLRAKNIEASVGEDTIHRELVDRYIEPSKFSTLVIQKKPGTVIEPLSIPKKVWINLDGFKVAIYPMSDGGIVRVSESGAKLEVEGEQILEDHYYRLMNQVMLGKLERY